MSIPENHYLTLKGAGDRPLPANLAFDAPPKAASDPLYPEQNWDTPSSPQLSPRRISADSRARTDSNGSTSSIASLATAWNSIDLAASPKPRRKSSLASPVFFRDGPLPSPPTSPNRPSLVDRSNNHGLISRQEAEARLKTQGMPIGMYLLREKEANRMYALSVVVPDGIKHHLIERSVRKDKSLGNHYVLNGKRLRDCTTLQHVITMLKEMKGAEGAGVLTIPCPCPRPMESFEHPNCHL
eukprot:m.31143 g.31143  ORF g.31143 m.31143 type:complete len:241 (+) comp12038_c0_seq1:128-850(+)